MNDPLSSAPNAGLVKRFAAMFYDTLLLFGVLFTATLIPALLLNGQQQQNANGTVVHELHPLMTGPAFQGYLLLVLVLFFCLFWHKQGQTLGMQAWKLKLVNQHNQPPTILQCLQRLLYALISFACLGMGYWWLWLDKEHLTWHDRWSKTRVLQLSKS
ncbi:RDD family protein [Dasania sp. GY-MA-18]|uniref:RDD family protein n=1 Tax=Dasania phycosphaerae TaxID=2950436 RepID=A0A9J6RNY7_9GAMM|nr:MULTISPECIES: RDD family protein [Dasania]MCR8923293.1 RDD family protein [Dasania sp. GY-MA-18]MCZ0865725.1 RDD family protein [Dasania phycosphaerae]MCZ0869450.1 RDD family protein [Dasania phycosphaerae]